ncbi:transcriptional regulator, TetR family [Nocardioides terrae]|uniref:Transcriptional regulator, TetR family n=1 Tax=Nocardioides terrae TaxID=574651 RepID=A0A1I1DEX1_9ACTN|nr:TetR/AcrR family transcriptional regulator [Nocardioides terrae]SFB72926.1 transcriptional regulator, TetR family [Nocardioides terrae]
MLGEANRDRVSERREATRREILDAAWALAREVGLAGITLRDIARRVGMQAPSLYTHFASKNAIYDAMFAQAWSTYEQVAERDLAELANEARAAVQQVSRTFFDFAVADLARYQLMNQRTVPGFEPSAESYAPAVRILERGVAVFGQLGLEDRADFDIWLALIGGLADQQHANDPGGDRFSRLLVRAVDMWADAVGLPPSASAARESRTARRAPRRAPR